MNSNVSITLIGLQANAVGKQSLSGKVILETRNTLVLETSKGRKVLPKKNTEFEFTDTEIGRIHGSAIIGRPEERIEKLV
jgi:RNase P/RNase MRP subunit p29